MDKLKKVVEKTGDIVMHIIELSIWIVSFLGIIAFEAYFIWLVIQQFK